MRHAHVSMITLGVTELRRTARFYEMLGFVRKMKAAGEDVAFFEAGGVVLSLFENKKLADDAALQPEADLPDYRGIALAWNCGTETEVDEVLVAARDAGGRQLKPAQKAFWGGYHGYFADPEGHIWEVAHNPHFPLSAEGRPSLPD